MEIKMANTKNGKRILVIVIVAVIIMAAYAVGPRVFDLFLEMHGL